MNTTATLKGIYNLALIKMGISQFVTDPATDNTPDTKTMNNAWDSVLNEVLELGEWKCARKREVLFEGLPFLDHGNCESADIPHVTGDSATLINASFARSDDRFYKGSYSFKLTKVIVPGDPGTARLTKYTNEPTDRTDLHGLTPGRAYRLFGRCFVPSAGGPSNVEESVMGISYYDGGAWTHVVVKSSKKNTWEFITTGKVTIPITATGIYLYVGITSPAENTEYVYWDQLGFNEITVQESGWNYLYQFALPSDCVKVLQTDIDSYPWREEGYYLVTNAKDDEINILYIYYLSDPTYFSPLLIDALATRLAYMVCPALVKDYGPKRQALDQEFAALLRLARGEDARWRQQPDKHSALVTEV